MKQVMINIGEAKAHLSEYARKVKRGQRFILCDRNKPFAELRPLQLSDAGKRAFGLGAGRIRLPDDFLESDPEIESLFAGETE